MNGPAPGLSGVRPFILLAALVAVLCLPLIFSTRESNYTWDEQQYYLPGIRRIREHWPRLDLVQDSLSATAPGYQYALAGISFLTGTGRTPLRLVNFAVSLGLLALLGQFRPTGFAPRDLPCVLLPLAVSNFFVKSASFLVTDNAALLLVAAALVSLFFTAGPGGSRRAGVFTAAAVFVRQSNLWLAAPLAVRIARQPDLGAKARQSLLLLLPAAVMFLLWRAWGGLVPPLWKETMVPGGTIVPASGAYLLSVLALLGPAYYASTRPADWRGDLASRWSLAGGLAGLVFALAGANTPDYAAGRWGGYLWSLAAHLPAWGGHSPVFLFLSPVGGVVLGLLARSLWRETGPAAAVLWLAAFAGWTASALVNRQVFHRYYEPPMLVLMICWLYLVTPGRREEIRRWPLLVLGTVQLAITLVTVHAATFGST